MMLCCEMAIIAPFFLVAYSNKNYKLGPTSTASGPYYKEYQGGPLGVYALMSALNYFNLVGELWRGFRAKPGQADRAGRPGAPANYPLQNYNVSSTSRGASRHQSGRRHDTDRRRHSNSNSRQVSRRERRDIPRGGAPPIAYETRRVVVEQPVQVASRSGSHRSHRSHRSQSRRRSREVRYSAEGGRGYESRR